MGVFSLLTASYFEPDSELQETPNSLFWREVSALKLQGILMSMFILICTAACILLKYKLELWRGIDRLHWFYLGFQSFSFILFYSSYAILWVKKLWVFSMQRLKFRRFQYCNENPENIRERCVLVVKLLIVILCLDQMIASFRNAPTFAKNIGIRSYVDFEKGSRPVWKYSEFFAKKFPIKPPAWVSETDRILSLDYFFRYAYAANMDQFVYYRELFSEAFVYQKMGPAFLTWWHAYNKLQAGNFDESTKELLKDFKVTILVFPDTDQYKSLKTQIEKARIEVSQLSLPVEYTEYCLGLGFSTLPGIALRLTGL